MKKVLNFISAQVYMLKIMFSISPLLTLLSVMVYGINAGAPIFSAYLLKILTDQLKHTYTTMSVSGSLWLYIGAYVFYLALLQIFTRWCAVASGCLGNKMQHELNTRLFDIMSNLDIAFYDDPSNMDMLKKINHFKGTVSDGTSMAIDLMMKLISLLAAFITFIPYNPWLGIFYIITFVPGSVMQYRNNKTINQFSLASIPETRKKDYYKSILTDVYYAKELRLYNNAEYIKGKMKNSWDIIRKERNRIFNKGTWMVFFFTTISYIGWVFLLLWSINAASLGIITIGTLSMYVSLSQMVGNQFHELTVRFPYYYNVMVPQILAYKTFVDVNPTANVESEGELEEAPHFPCIEFKDVCFKYPGADSYAINHLNFKIESKEIVALVGINGAGKTTIVKLLLRFYEPNEGQILINGKDIRSYSLKSVRNLFGVCFQEVNKYALTFRENIAISDIERINNTEEIMNAAKLSGANKIYLNIPKGLDANLTRNFDNYGYEPSGGQWQKIAISRALFRKSDIIILDEPSSALDPEAEDYIFSQFKMQCADKGGILISHRLSSISMVDKVIVIDQGTLVGCGTHSELIQKNEYYARLYHMQADKYKEVTVE